MKKVVLILMIVLLVGCAPPQDAGEPVDNTNTADQEADDNTEKQEETNDDSKEMMEEEEMKKESTSLVDALKFSGEMKCTVKGDQDGMSIDGTYWIKDGKHATDFQIDSERLYSIFDGETMYSWGHSQLAEGQKFKLSDIESLAKSAGVDLETPEEQAEGYEGLEPDCMIESVDDSRFTPPSDVTFNDLGEMLAQVEDMMANMPEGFEMPSGMQ